MNKEQIIEEMAMDIPSKVATERANTMSEMYYHEHRIAIATELYNAGYRKETQGKWVLHRPRVRGRNATYICSVCQKLVSSYYNDVGNWKCCPHCGAHMTRGETK